MPPISSTVIISYYYIFKCRIFFRNSLIEFNIHNSLFKVLNSERTSAYCQSRPHNSTWVKFNGTLDNRARAIITLLRMCPDNITALCGWNITYGIPRFSTGFPLWSRGFASVELSLFWNVSITIFTWSSQVNWLYGRWRVEGR